MTVTRRLLIATFAISFGYLSVAAAQDRSVPPPADRIHTVTAEHGIAMVFTGVRHFRH